MPDFESLNSSHALPWWKNARGEWYVVAQIALFALVAVGPLLPDVALDLPAGLRNALIGAGLALLAGGGALALAGLLALDGNLSILPHPKAGAHLVERGPYALVRHPIYGGIILGAIGWALLLGRQIAGQFTTTASTDTAGVIMASGLIVILLLVAGYLAASRRAKAFLVH